MKILFRVQLAFSVLILVSNLIGAMFGRDLFQIEHIRHLEIVALVSAGFLWIHSVISGLKVKS